MENPGSMDSSEYQSMYEAEETHFYFAGKRSLVAEMLSGRLAPGARILDAGCGTGATMRRLSAFGEPFGVDLSEEAVRFCRMRGPSPAAVANAQGRLPFRDASFDAACLLDVIEHIDDERAVLTEIARVVRPSGVVVITVPAVPWLFSYHDRALGHRRRYAKAALVSLVLECGLRIDLVTHFNAWLLGPAVVARAGMTALRRGCPPRTDTALRIPAPLNSILLGLCRIEARIARRLPLPAGLGLACVARKA